MSELKPAQIMAAKLLIVLGPLVAVLMGGVLVALRAWLLDPEAAAASGQWGAPPEALTWLGVGLLGFLAFGVVATVAGVTMVRTGRKSGLLTVLTFLPVLVGVLGIARTILLMQ
ncbi:MAG: hypothetical protein MUE98_12305 [Rhodobacteraceae bacterium]|jgi:hypothetical protein|nr:hypothetical protein [Paracoccaceae bacterium]